MIARPLLVLSIAAAACGDDGNMPKDAAVDAPIMDMGIDVPDGRGPCPVGDTTMPIEIEPGYIHPNTAAFTPIAEMEQAPITDSQQGFWVLRMGMRVRNVDPCGQFTMTAALRDTCVGNQLLKVENRTILLSDNHDGWAVPSNLSYYSALHACPYPTPQRDLYNQPYKIEIVLKEDSTGKMAQTSVHVVPVCPNDPSCLCQCDRDYVVGGSCPPATDTGPGPVCNPP